MENTVFFSDREFDYQTLRKVAAINSHLGMIGFHPAEGGTLLSFKSCPDGAETAIGEYKKYLEDFTKNIWSH